MANKLILVTGGSGVIGKILVNYLREKGFSLLVPTRDELNLQKVRSIHNYLIKEKPSVIIHLGARTHIDHCEVEQGNKTGEIWQINVKAVEEIVSYAEKNKTKIIYLSTECVFDGIASSFSEDDKPNPINWYGLTKFEAEKIILSRIPKASILRAVATYYPELNRETLWGELFYQLKNNKSISVVDDQQLTLTYTPDIAHAVMQSVINDFFGILHVTPPVKVSPFQFAKEIANFYEINTKINPISLESFMGNKKAKLRLRNACLDSNFTRKKTGLYFHSVVEVIKKATENYI